MHPYVFYGVKYIDQAFLADAQGLDCRQGAGGAPAVNHYLTWIVPPYNVFGVKYIDLVLHPALREEIPISKNPKTHTRSAPRFPLTFTTTFT